MDGSIFRSSSLVNPSLNRYVELSNSVSVRTDQRLINNDDDDLTLLSLKKDIDDLKEKNEHLQSTVTELEDYVDVLFDQIDLNLTYIIELQRYTRRENIELVGFPESVLQSDPEQTVLGILASINIKINSYNIALVRSVSTIIVHFMKQA